MSFSNMRLPKVDFQKSISPFIVNVAVVLAALWLFRIVTDGGLFFDCHIGLNMGGRGKGRE